MRPKQWTLDQIECGLATFFHLAVNDRYLVRRSRRFEIGFAKCQTASAHHLDGHTRSRRTPEFGAENLMTIDNPLEGCP
jgi:hypothetical protein